MNFNFAEICTNIFNYLSQYLVKVDSDLPWLKYFILATIVLALLSRIMNFFNNKSHVARNVKFMSERKTNSKKIMQQSTLKEEKTILKSELTYAAFDFKFSRYKNIKNKDEKPNFNKLILSFFTDAPFYKGTFVNLGNSNLKQGDRKSTRLNSSHGYISYAVFCLKKRKK